jgi:hypothetical protein
MERVKKEAHLEKDLTYLIEAAEKKREGLRGPERRNRAIINDLGLS